MSSITIHCCNLRPRGSTTLGTKVEIKNLNSFLNVQHALEFEARRQAKALDAGERIVQETRLWDADRGYTRSMRSKEFAHDYRYIKTIAVSVFSMRERTSWHFGPLRLTLRVLYVLDPMKSGDAFIEVDDRLHRWMDDRLFIFDDTNFHRSTNGSDQPRYCLFMDIVRPNHARVAFDAGIHLMRVLSGSLKRLFYKNWAFVR